MVSKMTKEIIRKIFERLPRSERKMPALIIDGETLTWEQIWDEVKNNGTRSEKIQKEIERLRGEVNATNKS